MNDQTKPVVVGFDGSPHAALALRWGADQARLEGRPLRVVVARGDLYKLSRWADDWTRGLADEWGELACKELAGLGVDEVDVVVRDGLPAQVLIRESEQASAIVIGSHGHGPVTSLLQGSVSEQVTRHAACPVVVVRIAEDHSSARVVVGVDGSAASIEALRVGLAFALQRHFEVRVVFSPERWQGYEDARPVELVPELIAEFESREKRVREQIGEAGRQAGVDIDVHEVPSRPAPALIDASHSAALVVVGCRGRGAFAGMVLGSVSSDVLRHAHCPVVVVR